MPLQHAAPDTTPAASEAETLWTIRHQLQNGGLPPTERESATERLLHIAADGCCQPVRDFAAEILADRGVHVLDD